VSTVATAHDEIYLGSFVKAFGIKGELKFVASDDFWPDTLDSKRLVMQSLKRGEVERRPMAIERWRPHGHNFVVRLKHVADRNDAEAEVGGELFIDVNNLDVDLPDEERPFQVVGSTVRLEDGNTIGRVTSVIHSAAHNVYEVTGDSGVVLIPAVPEFVVARDTDTAEIIIRPIPGLLDG
jgi:16S rRNA processing protein RimM